MVPYYSFIVALSIYTFGRKTDLRADWATKCEENPKYPQGKVKAERKIKLIQNINAEKKKNTVY